MSEITVYGATWCPDCRRSKQFLSEQRIAFTWVDIEDNPAAQAFVESKNDGRRIIPTIVFGDGSVLVEPSNAALAAKLGIVNAAKQRFYDLVVIGGGPTGLTAALYGAREGMQVLVIERAALGGQAGVTEKLDNFPGFPEGISGSEFADRLARQARRFGVETLTAQEVTGLRKEAGTLIVQTADGQELEACAVLLATGSTYRRLNVPGEDEYIGAGVHFCATCDGPFYKDQDIVVIGSGNSAGEEGLFLTRFARKVRILARGAALNASKVVIDNIATTPAIDVLTDTEVVGFEGGAKLDAVRIRNRASGETSRLPASGAFVFIGLSPNSAWLPPEIARDASGFVITSDSLETSLPGVFAAGDVRKGSTKQAASAAGEGAAAALMIREYLKRH